VDLFELVLPEAYTYDYLEEGARDERAVVVRTLGRADIAPVSNIPGNATVNWAAALFVMGESSVEDKFLLNPDEFQINIYDATWPDRIRALDIMRWWPARNVGLQVWRDKDNTAVQNVISEDRLSFEWDVALRRRMKTDDALWLLIANSGAASPAVEVNVTGSVAARTLIHDS